MHNTLTNRIEYLLDENSFNPINGDISGEVVGGIGTVNGFRVCILAINPNASLDVDAFEVLQHEITILDLVDEHKIPLVYLADRPKRIAMETTGVPTQILPTFINPNGVGKIFAKFAKLSGIIPRISVVFNTIATTLTYPVAECDTVVMVKNSGMSLARPDMVKLMTGDMSSYEDYGSAKMHAEVSGTCHVLVESEKEALDWVKNYLDFLPPNYTKKPLIQKIEQHKEDDRSIDQYIPLEPSVSFDMLPLIKTFLDKGSFLERQKLFAREVITGFGRIDGMPLGIIGSNSKFKGGILFAESCRKIISFLSLCDAFNIPIVFLADIPGFMVGKDAEQKGIIQHGALLFTTIANLSVPHQTVVIRKAYTAGLYAMGGPGFDPEKFMALQNAKIRIYGEKAIHLLVKNIGVSKEE